MLLTPEEASLQNCMMTFNLSPNKNDGSAFKCCHGYCMGWQWEDLSYAGGTASRGFCGMIPIQGRRKVQDPNLCY